MALDTKSTFWSRFASLWFGLPFLLYALLILINPIGYIGGGSDDWHYLKAARCIAAQGWCTPDNHWAARWTLNLPLAFALRWIEDPRLALNLVTWIFGAAGLGLLLHLVHDFASRGAAVIAGLLFVVTPVTGFALLTVNVDLPELFFLLSGVAAAQRSQRYGYRGWALAAGIAFGLAFATRETAAAWLVPLILIAAYQRWWRLLGYGLAGASLIVASEALFHLITSGDALLRFKLAMGHTQIASSEMIGARTSSFPLFNPDVIASWRPAAGIDLHWALNPIVNLAVHPWCRMLVLVSVGLTMARYGLPRSHSRPLIIAVLTGIGLLVYGFAIDPKPRMFIPAFAALSLVAGAGLSALFHKGHCLLMVALLGLTGCAGLAITTTFSGVAEAEDSVRAWESELGIVPVFDPTSRFAMALLDGDGGWAAKEQEADGGRHRISVSNTPCSAGSVGSRAHYSGLLKFDSSRKTVASLITLPAPVYVCLYPPTKPNGHPDDP